MKQHEREYFVSRVRSGLYIFKYNKVKLKLVTPTIQDEFEINQVYQDSYLFSLNDGYKTNDEMLDWNRTKGLWTDDDDRKIEGLNKDLERLKIEIYNARNNTPLKERIRLYLRAGEKQLSEQNEKKNRYFTNTCEGIASLDKMHEFFRRCTFIGQEPCDFESIPIEYICSKYYSYILPDGQIRELARNEPWRSLWVMKNSNSYKIFDNIDRELSVDQKNILIWSSMYDNVQESMECPPDDIINDDDMLDGWFLIQRNKREKERSEAEMENNTNPKIANSDEIFVVTKSKEDSERVDNMNDITAKMIKKERMQVLKQKGSAKQLDFRDEKLKMQRQSNEQFKGKFKR